MRLAIKGITLCLALLGTLPLAFGETPDLNKNELNAYGMGSNKAHPNYLLLDFFSATCGVCQQTEPIFKEMQKHLKSNIQFTRIDADKQPKQMEKFHVEGTPGYILFDANGKPVYKMQRYVSLEILFTNLQRYTGQLRPLPVPDTLLNKSAILTTDEIKAPHYTLIAIHPDNCEPCKKQIPLLNGMALAKGNNPRLNVITWDPAQPEIQAVLKQNHWNGKQGYVFLDPEHHELVTVSGNPEPKTFWQTLSMLMDDGLSN